MKRSEINAVIKRFEKLLEEHRFELPPFCKWTPEEWQTKGHEYDEIRDNMLGLSLIHISTEPTEISIPPSMIT